MSFYNQDVDGDICINCKYVNAPYLSSYGTYTPCLECVDGSNAEVDGSVDRSERVI